MLQYNPSISGSLSVTGSLIVTNGVIGTVNGVDVEIFSSSISQVVTNIQTTTGSQSGRLTSIESFTSSVSTTNTFTSSASARLSSIETVSASNLSRLNSIETITSSNISRLNSIETITASNISRLTSLEITTGSLATTGSNTFIGTQTITGSLFISSNLIVQGTSSLQNITASAVSIGTNIINLNTANPAIRYAGLSIGDSGSVGGSGSFLYDSVQDEMLFIHRGDSAVVTSSVALMGPETYDNVGNETYPTLNIIQKGTGKEHLVDSCIFDNGTTTCIKNNLIGTGTITGTTIYGSIVVCSAVGYFSGCVGIGTSTPATKLHVEAICPTRGIIGTIKNATQTGAQVHFVQDSVADWVIGQPANTNAFAFWNNRYPSNDGTELMRITSTGNVGIGITTPGDLLHIEKCQAGGMGMIIRNSCGATSNTSMCSLISLQLVGVGQSGQIGVNLIAGKEGDYSSAGVRNAFFAIQTACGDNLYERMRITSGGKIGIGCTTPQKNLTVDGCIGMSNTYNWGITNDNDANWGFRVCSTGVNYSTFLSYAGDAGSDRRGGIYNQNGHWVAYGNCQGHFIVQCNVGIGITDDNPIGNGGTYRNLLVGNGAGYGVFQGISTATATDSTIVAFSGGTTGASANKNGGSINLQLDGTSTSRAIGRWVFYTNSATDFAERMRITSAGVVEVKKNILVGLEFSASQYLAISENQIYRTGNGTMYINNSATGDVVINQYGGATYLNGTNGYGRAVTNSSDERIKKNIIKIDNALEKIISMDGVYYEFDSENNLGISVPSGNIRIGLIAQQIENILPEAVFTSTEENEPKSIDYSGMIGLLIEGMKEQQCTIDTLKSCLGIS